MTARLSGCEVVIELGGTIHVELTGWIHQGLRRYGWLKNFE